MALFGGYLTNLLSTLETSIKQRVYSAVPAVTIKEKLCRIKNFLFPDPKNEPRWMKITSIVGWIVFVFCVVGLFHYVITIQNDVDLSQSWTAPILSEPQPPLYEIVLLSLINAIGALSVAASIIRRNEHNVLYLTLKIFVLICAFIGEFALLYAVGGLVSTHCTPFDLKSCDHELYREGKLSLYFSAITLSTVGYGDFIPANGVARAAAATEAVTGYFLLALLIAAFTKALKPKKTKKRKTKKAHDAGNEMTVVDGSVLSTTSSPPVLQHTLK